MESLCFRIESIEPTYHSAPQIASQTVQRMKTRGVLVFGCSDPSSPNKGLEADERAIAAQHVAVRTISVGSVTNDGGDQINVLDPSIPFVASQTAEAMRDIACSVVKIGALFTEESVKLVSETLRQGTQLKSIIDAEPFFKTGPAPKPELATALIRDLLPSVTILSATVPEAKALLDNAQVPVDYPKSMQDVVTMANALCQLGPEYAIIKREVFEEDGKMTTLHYVLCGSNMEPVIATSRFENPMGMFGVSYSVPPAIAAYMAQGYSVPDAVAAGFKFAEEMITKGQYFPIK